MNIHSSSFIHSPTLSLICFHLQPSLMKKMLALKELKRGWKIFWLEKNWSSHRSSCQSLNLWHWYCRRKIQPKKCEMPWLMKWLRNPRWLSQVFKDNFGTLNVQKRTTLGCTWIEHRISMQDWERWGLQFQVMSSCILSYPRSLLLMMQLWMPLPPLWKNVAELWTLTVLLESLKLNMTNAKLYLHQ